MFEGESKGLKKQDNGAIIAHIRDYFELISTMDFDPVEIKLYVREIILLVDILEGRSSFCEIKDRSD